MAMVLDAFASYVQNMLTEMVREEVHMLLGVKDDIDKMDVRLKDLKNFLADADRRNITDETVRDWVAELKRAMYEATDILDLCQLKAMECGPSNRDLGCFNPLLFCMRNPAHAHDIGTRIKALNKSLENIKARSAAFSFINLGPNKDRNSRVQASHPGIPSRETSGEFDRSGVVGEKIKEDTRAIVDMMLTEKEGNANIMVVAIVGVGGIGKTTLAQKVFNDEIINAEFDKTIWLSINQNFDKVELIKTIITLSGGQYGSGTALAVLQSILTTAVAGKKLFLVMDDVWSPGACADMLGSNLANVVARGSRILVTTRDERVARGMKAMFPYHHINKLEEEDGWSLLKKQLVSSETDGHAIDTLKDIGLQIVARCDGLPLAIKVLGGLLCQKERRHSEWEMVLDDSMWSVSEMPEELNHAIYLSYEDLPSCIKPCFLYYSLLPKTALFFINDIVGMWISEGFLHGTLDDLEELGSKYCKELILRNLIEPNPEYITQSCCSMHDVVRTFAQFIARDEALATQSDESDIARKLSAQKFLRLSIESKESESDGLVWSSLQAQTTLRTLISVGHINMKLDDSLVHFPCLRTLHISSARITLVGHLHELKHLRYLSLERLDIPSLPESIGNMKFLQYISIAACEQFLKLPDSIVKLGQLRYLDLNAKAKLSEKLHLTDLELNCSSRLGDNGLIEEEDVIFEEEQQRIEHVFVELCPPSRLDNLNIKGYFGRQLPRWMMSSSVVALKSLRTLMLEGLACCTQLPDGLSQLPYLEFIQIKYAPAIKHVGPEFLQSYHHQSPRPSHVAVAFPRLQKMSLMGMVEWEEWEWEEQVHAFPVLQKLILSDCKLRRLPPGLASQARSLNELWIGSVQGLLSVENLASLVELVVINDLDLEMITNLPRLQKLTIEDCPKLKVLEGVPVLHRLVLDDDDMEILPEYLRGINPRHLELHCSLVLLASIAVGQSGPEWDKFSHVEHVKAYASEGDNPRKWYVLYRANPYNLETNISRSFMSTGILSYFEDGQRFESVFKMTRKTFNYICSIVFGPSMEDMNSYRFIDVRVLCLEDRVAVALRRLYSSEPLETLGSSVGVNESTINLVTDRFIAVVCQRAVHHIMWPDSGKMDKIKSMFGKIHNMHNCCGVICTTHIPIGPNCDSKKNASILMRVIVDPEMRFTEISLEWEGSMNWCTNLQEGDILKDCEKGIFLNGSKLQVAADGSEVGEYIIGDAGYPLHPWLLTPYQEDDLSDSKAQFNRRHVAATTCATKALARFQDTWQFLQEQTPCPLNAESLADAIYACCLLHNIVIDMEDETAMPSVQGNYRQEARQVANEDAVRARDMLSQYFLTSMSSESGVDPVVALEDHEVTASSSGGEGKEQEPHTGTVEEEDNVIQDIII